MALKKGVVEEFFGDGFCGNSGHYQGSLWRCVQAGSIQYNFTQFFNKVTLVYLPPNLLNGKSTT